MTTIGLREQITFGGFDLASYATVVSNLSGFDDFPAMRGENPALTGLPGRQYLAKLFDSRRPTLGMFVTSLTAAGAAGTTNRQQARANIDALYVVLGRRGQQALVRKMPDASLRTGMAEVISVGSVVDHAGGQVFGLVATFDMADPYFYGIAITDSARSISTSPTNFNIGAATTGSAPDAYRIAFDITGPAVNPRITNTTTGTYVEFIGTVASTKHLVIDCYASTAVNDGVAVPGAINHSGAVSFLTMAPGVNAMVVSHSGATGAVMTTTYYPAYL